MRRELTGRHVLIICLAAFGVIIAANLTLAFQAVRTFPGIEVRNGYVASQSFEAERQAQEALGWTVDARLEGERFVVSFAGRDGAPAEVVSLDGIVGRATEAAEDRALVFTRTRSATFEAPAALTRGAWVAQLKATAADGTAWRSRVSISVR